MIGGASKALRMCQEDKSYPLQVKSVKREMKKPLAGILGRWEVFPVFGEVLPVFGDDVQT